MHQLNDWAGPSNIHQLVPKTILHSIATPRDHLPDTRPTAGYHVVYPDMPPPRPPLAAAMLIYIETMLSVGWIGRTAARRRGHGAGNDSVRPDGSPARHGSINLPFVFFR